MSTVQRPTVQTVRRVRKVGYNDNWRGMMAQESRGDEHSPKTINMNSKKSRKSATMTTVIA